MLLIKPSWENWRLLTEKGRQIWAYKCKSGVIGEHLNEVTDFSDAEAKQFTEDFSLDKGVNPNSADKVFRHVAFNEKFRPFGEQIPQGKTAQEQQSITALLKGINYFSTLQADEGHWPGDYGGPLFLLPGLIIAAHFTQTPLPKPHQEMMKIYMLNHQNLDGGWGLHIEGGSTMFGTVMQYVSLRLLGVASKDQRLSKARAWIQAHGGATGIPSWGKFNLAMLNLYDWQGFNSLFPEMWLLPKWLPVHPWRYWCHCRLVYLPMAYCYAQRLKMPEDDLIRSLRAEIYCQDYEAINWSQQRDSICKTDVYTAQSVVLKLLNFFTNSYEKFYWSGFRNKALNYILKYIDAEDQQTSYLDLGPVSQAINSICIWHAYGKDSAQFKRHVARWFDYLWVAEDGMKMNGYNGSQFWDVAFTTRAILESDLSRYFQNTVEKSYRFITESQILAEHETHQQFFRHPMIGSWPFSTAEQGWPVADCTAEGLGATLSIHRSGLVKPVIDEQRIRLAVEVILSFQNKDGGWPTYELARAAGWMEKLNPSGVFADIMIDYSYTECTAACVLALLDIRQNYPDYLPEKIHAAVNQGLQFIIGRQKPDGSWYGSWGICFTYATWFAVEALSLARGTGCADDEKLNGSTHRACNFLLAKQKADGGWGETFESCTKREYVEAEQSQVVNTAWALLALMAAGDIEKPVIEQGIQLLINRQHETGDWSQENISGVFNYNCMITYSAYRNIFPIWALGRYYRLYL